MTEREIIYIEGMEPMREGHYPPFFKVGEDNGMLANKEVVAITHRLDKRGDHAVGWFDVWTEENGSPVLATSMNERAVAIVGYPVDEDGG